MLKKQSKSRKKNQRKRKKENNQQKKEPNQNSNSKSHHLERLPNLKGKKSRRLWMVNKQKN